jgi:hypothetical protein
MQGDRASANDPAPEKLQAVLHFDRVELLAEPGESPNLYADIRLLASDHNDPSMMSPHGQPLAIQAREVL